MKTLIHHMLHKKGLPGLFATTWGFSFGEAILLGTTAIVATILGAGTLLSEVIVSIVAVTTLPLLVVLIKQEWDEPQVKSIGMFLAVFLVAVIFAALMPFVIAWVILKTHEEVSAKRAKEASRSYRVSSSSRNSGIEHLASQVEGTYRRRVTSLQMRYGI